jgi:hypothetical protein
LKSVFRIVVIRQKAAADTPNDRCMPSHQRLQSRVLSVAREAIKHLSVGKFRSSRSTARRTCSTTSLMERLRIGCPSYPARLSSIYYCREGVALIDLFPVPLLLAAKLASPPCPSRGVAPSKQVPVENDEDQIEL